MVFFSRKHVKQEQRDKKRNIRIRVTRALLYYERCNQYFMLIFTARNQLTVVVQSSRQQNMKATKVSIFFCGTTTTIIISNVWTQLNPQHRSLNRASCCARSAARPSRFPLCLSSSLLKQFSVLQTTGADCGGRQSGTFRNLANAHVWRIQMMIFSRVYSPTYRFQ